MEEKDQLDYHEPDSSTRMHSPFSELITGILLQMISSNEGGKL